MKHLKAITKVTPATAMMGLVSKGMMGRMLPFMATFKSGVTS